MEPLKKALDEIKFNIPRAVLKVAFQDNQTQWRQSPISIDERILNDVIRSRVLVDCNLAGGQEAYISLDGLAYESYDDYVYVYHIPAERLDGRTIISALGVGYFKNIASLNTTGLNYTLPQYAKDTLLAGSAVMNSMSSQPIMSTAEVSLIAENTIMVRNQNISVALNILRCIMANDPNLNNIKMRAIPAFCELAVLAVKSYVYNFTTIELGQGQLSGGQELGRIKEVIDEYASAEAEYREFLTTKWAKVSLFNDDVSVQRLIKLMVGPYK